MNIREQLPYKDIPSALMTLAQANVSIDDKRAVRAALAGDDGILTLVIQCAFKRAADFVRENKFNFYDSANYDTIIRFICDGTDPRPARNAAQPADTRAVAGNKPTLPSPTSKPRGADETVTRRGRSKT